VSELQSLKKVRKLKGIVIAGGVFAAIALGGYLACSYCAVRWLQSHLHNISPELTIGAVQIHLTCLSLREIQYDEPSDGKRLLKVEEVRVYPSLQSLLTGRPEIRELSFVHPVFYVFRQETGDFIGPLLPVGRMERRQNRLSPEKRTEHASVPTIRIGKIHMGKGSIEFEDQTYGKPPVRIELRDLSFQIEDVYFPFISSSRCPFQLKGKITENGQEGHFESKGWVSLQTLDMETSFKIAGVQVKTFEPYYRKRVSAEIESGEATLEAKISIKGKIIDAPVILEIMNLHFKKGREGGTVFWVPAEALISLLGKKENRLRARFEVKGDMNKPGFNLQENVLTCAGIALAEALGFPITEFSGIVRETLFGGAGKGGKGLEEKLKSLEGIFRKKD